MACNYAALVYNFPSKIFCCSLARIASIVADCEAILEAIVSKICNGKLAISYAGRVN